MLLDPLSSVAAAPRRGVPLWASLCLLGLLAIPIWAAWTPSAIAPPRSEGVLVEIELVYDFHPSP